MAPSGPGGREPARVSASTWANRLGQPGNAPGAGMGGSAERAGLLCSTGVPLPPQLWPCAVRNLGVVGRRRIGRSGTAGPPRDRAMACARPVRAGTPAPQELAAEGRRAWLAGWQAVPGGRPPGAAVAACGAGGRRSPGVVGRLAGGFRGSSPRVGVAACGAGGPEGRRAWLAGWRGVPGGRPPGLVLRPVARAAEGRRAWLAGWRGVPGGRPPGLVLRPVARAAEGRRAWLAGWRGVPGGRPPGLVLRPVARAAEGRQAWLAPARHGTSRCQH